MEVEQVRFIRELYGEVEPGLRFKTSNIPLGQAQRTLRLFAFHVVSALSTSEVVTPTGWAQSRGGPSGVTLGLTTAPGSLAT